jgi:hypothetical protein
VGQREAGRIEAEPIEFEYLRQRAVPPLVFLLEHSRGRPATWRFRNFLRILGTCCRIINKATEMASVKEVGGLLGRSYKESRTRAVALFKKR